MFIGTQTKILLKISICHLIVEHLDKRHALEVNTMLNSDVDRHYLSYLCLLIYSF